ncbi:MAG: CoA transferase [Myxococcales bacterium]|nr:CoA transferase [Myxococcales bacterium]
MSARSETDALGGLRVVDLSRGFAGALVSQLFADHGAEVIHIEAPGGDALREEPAFHFWQRGKKSVLLDLGDARGREHAQRLARSADLFLETFRPGVAERLGLGYEELASENPQLLYASITGFGRQGPYAHWKGYEGVVMAKLGGMDHAAGMAPRPGPAFPAAPFASFSAAQTALQGILAALYVRERTGRGQRIDTSLVQGMTAHDPWDWFLRLVAERYPDAFKTAPPVSERGVPNQSFAFRLLVCLSRDGHWLQFSQTSPHLFRDFMTALGLDWMFQDPEWSSAPEFESEEKRERFWEQLLEAAGRLSLAEWQRTFEEEPNVWAEIYRSTRELLDHPQMRHNGHVIEVEDPRVGTTTQLAPMVGMAKTPGLVRAPAPEPDEHREEILAALEENPAPSRVRRGEPLPQRPLEGVTVLEFGLYYAAPFGPAILADLGARVIKIEPKSGEPMRRIMPFPDAGAVKSLQGKESVVIDAAHPRGRALIHQLARRADIAMVSYRAGVALKHGIDYATLSALNPDLIYLNAPGYGVDGPCGRKPAFAPTIGAGSGMGILQAGPSVPLGGDLTLTDIKQYSLRLGAAAQSPGNADGFSALCVGSALLLGLVARERTGIAQEMMTSMLATTAYALSADCIEYQGRPPARLPDPELHGFSALYRLYECAEGWLFLAAPQASEWGALCRALAAHADLAADVRFASEPGRRKQDAALAEALAGIFRRRPAADWERELVACDVGCAEVARGPISRATMDDAITRDAGFLREVEHPSFGRHRRMGPLAALSLTPGLALPACSFGQHTESVLRELGHESAAIEELEAEGVIVRAGD